jgi:hypothetical protein
MESHMRVIAQGLVYDAALALPAARFASFTCLTMLDNGRLFAAFRVGSSKDSADEDIRVMASDDSGLTWRMVFGGFGDVAGGSWRGRSFGITPHEGQLIGSLSAIDRSDAARPLANPATQGLLPAQILVTESTDGAVWQELRAVPLAPYAGCVTTGAILHLPGGVLALPYESWKDWDDAGYGKHRAALRLSSDGGRTWADTAVVAHDTTGRLLFWDQRVAVSADGKQLASMFWSHDRGAQEDVPIHIAFGSPDGKTWSEPASTGIAGQICTPCYLADGRLLAVYVHRHDPPGLRAVLSLDGGRSWELETELEFFRKEREGAESGMGGKRDFGDYWADMSVWTFGHPWPVVLPSGDILVIYYAGDAASLSVHWARIALEG